MEKFELEVMRDTAAVDALQARSRIEAAVDKGEVPIWVLEACEAWERSSMVYGAVSAQLNETPVLMQPESSRRLH